MILFEKIRKRRAKRHLMRALKIIGDLSWEELDSILPRNDYKHCFNSNNWRNAEVRYSVTKLKGYKESEEKTMTDNELTCGFKVGDEVITADGRTGVIDSVCECERCKERGFYEPSVRLKSGAYDIYITNLDKENGFANFYLIGKKVFGNIDIKSVEDDIERKKATIRLAEKELSSLWEQNILLDMLKNTSGV